MGMMAGLKNMGAIAVDATNKTVSAGRSLAGGAVIGGAVGGTAAAFLPAQDGNDRARNGITGAAFGGIIGGGMVMKRGFQNFAIKNSAYSKGYDAGNKVSTMTKTLNAHVTEQASAATASGSRLGKIYHSATNAVRENAAKIKNSVINRRSNANGAALAEDGSQFDKPAFERMGIFPGKTGAAQDYAAGVRARAEQARGSSLSRDEIPYQSLLRNADDVARELLPQSLLKSNNPEPAVASVVKQNRAQRRMSDKQALAEAAQPGYTQLGKGKGKGKKRR